MNASTATTVDPAEIARFNTLASRWWDPQGPSKGLIAMGPVRMTYLRDQLVRHFDLDTRARHPLEGLRVLDLGCGAGLVSEPLARLGAAVTGVDAAAENIVAAKAHANLTKLSIDYQATTAEALVAEGHRYDAVVSLEVIEHVADVKGFLLSCHTLLSPGGLLLFSTLNRTAQSYALAIVGAEYIARIVPRGTHSWRKFITPDEMTRMLEETGFEAVDSAGMRYSPLRNSWSLTSDRSMNYIGRAVRP